MQAAKVELRQLVAPELREGGWVNSRKNILNLSHQLLIALALISASVSLYILSCDGAGLLIKFASIQDYLLVAEVSIFYPFVLFLLFINLIYYVAEYGWLLRRREPDQPADGAVAAIYGADCRKPLLILVPSYKEEEKVVRQTLLSAALVEYPERRVILLIDDPPEAAGPADADGLKASRRLPLALQSLFATPADRMGRELAAYESRARRSRLDIREEASRVATLGLR